MTLNINSKIINLMNDLVRIRDDSVAPQNLTVFLAKTKTKDSNLPTDSTSVYRQPQTLSGKSAQSSRLPRKSSNQSTINVSRQLNSTRNIVSRNATTHSSQLPPTLENPNDRVSHLPKIVPIRKTDPKRIAERIEAQSSNAKLTTDEREALISRILTSELEIQSKVDAQAKELSLSPKTKLIRRHTTPLKRDRNDINQLMTSLMKKRLKIEAARAAQARIIFSPTVTSADQPERLETVPTPAENKQPYVRTSRARSRDSTIGRTIKQAKRNFGRSLTPIAEASELRDLDNATRNDDNEHNVEGHNRHNMETMIDQENFRQQRMESELSSELIQDIETSLLLQHSDNSDSLDELVIKDFAIRIVESEPDAVTSCLPITEQVIIESNKLKEMMDSVRERFQVKIARDKFAERRQQASDARATARARPVQSKINRNPTFENDKVTSSCAVPINILDSENWGYVALPKPIFGDAAEPDSDEDFLRERDMQFDDLFGTDNVSEPVNLRDISPQHEPLVSNRIIDKTQPPFSDILDSIGNIEDFESPQFSDIPSDESVRSDTKENLSTSGNDLEDPQFPSDGFSCNQSGAPKDSALKRSKIDFERTNQQQSQRHDATVETEHEKDIKKLKELIDSGALKTSIVNQRFEEGVLDLLLRQSDSLWDPIVAGIPILYFIPSQNIERSPLDTSIEEKNLESPLIKRPKPTLPWYMESLENGCTVNTENSDHDTAGIGADVNYDNVVDDNDNVLVRGLPKFSYEPSNVPYYLNRRKNVNIMDSHNEPDDEEDILGEQEMKIDDLFDDVAEPTYDFQKAKIMDDLEIKMKIIRKMTEKRDASSVNSGISRELENLRKPPTPKDASQRSPRSQSERDRTTVNIRKSVSFAGSVQDSEPKRASNVKSATARTSQENRTKSGEIKRWTTLNISEVKDLIEHARLAQAKHKGSLGITTSSKWKARNE